jgi:hypothetical protein
MNKPFTLQRRQWLAFVAALASPLAASAKAAMRTPQLAAAWESSEGYQVGVFDATRLGA